MLIKSKKIFLVGCAGDVSWLWVVLLAPASTILRSHGRKSYRIENKTRPPSLLEKGGGLVVSYTTVKDGAISNDTLEQGGLPFLLSGHCMMKAEGTTEFSASQAG